MDDTEVVRYFLMRRVSSGEPLCVFARVHLPGGRFFDFLCNAKREWRPDSLDHLACQLSVMPDLGFRGEISTEKVVRLGFPLFDIEDVIEDPAEADWKVED